MQEAARTLGHPIHVLNTSTGSAINTAFATIAQQLTDALLVAGDPFFLSRLYQFITLAARHAAVPTIYPQREYVAGGGLERVGSALDLARSIDMSWGGA